METNAVSNSQSAVSTSVGNQRLAESFDTFLVLLTTQMKNQDPLSPMDSGDFTQQIVQMTGVEQQLLTNDLLKQLVGSAGDGVADAVSLIGKQVRAATEEAALTDKAADWIFRLDREAQSVKIEVLDDKGAIVHVEALENVPGGEHDFRWDGKNVLGAQQPDGGTYPADHRHRLRRRRGGPQHLHRGAGPRRRAGGRPDLCDHRRQPRPLADHQQHRPAADLQHSLRRNA
jgi:flagellar basal-body rod modification protein FlgD